MKTEKEGTNEMPTKKKEEDKKIINFKEAAKRIKNFDIGFIKNPYTEAAKVKD